MGRAQALGDGGDDAFVRVRDDEPLVLRVEAASDQVLCSGSANLGHMLTDT